MPKDVKSRLKLLAAGELLAGEILSEVTTDEDHRQAIMTGYIALILVQSKYRYPELVKSSLVEAQQVLDSISTPQAQG